MRCPVCGDVREQPDEVCGACGADLTTLAPGTLLADRYEVRAYLGRGGMGSVYQAFDRVLDEEVALKVQRAQSARGPEAERRFRSEVKLARQVSHPNVCRLHDGGQEGALRWISMELVAGQTLAARLQAGSLSVEQVVSLGVQAAEGLAAVHRAGVVHRDLKTLNLMVDGVGRLRLMDFGIAKPAATGDTGAGGYALGSPEYMSPEQARGQPADARSDVYSLGVVLFELATGRVPFRAETPVATLLRHLQDPPPLDAAPEPLRPVLARALAKAPAERYADGAEMAEALRRVRDGRSQAPAFRRDGARRLAIVLGLAAAAVVAALSLRTRALEPSAPASPPASVPQAAEATVPSPSPKATAPGRVVSPPARPAPEVRAPVLPVPTPAVPEAPLPTPEPAVAAPATPPPTPSPTSAPDGWLLVVARPWADVSVDGIPRGQTPLARIALPPGSHAVLLTHPDYQPWPRRVTIRSGEVFRLSVDLPADGIARR